MRAVKIDAPGEALLGTIDIETVILADILISIANAQHTVQNNFEAATIRNTFKNIWMESEPQNGKTEY